MAAGTLKFIALAAVAVVLGVLSASFAFGKMGLSGPGISHDRFSWMNAHGTEDGSRDEIDAGLRHIMGR